MLRKSLMTGAAIAILATTAQAETIAVPEYPETYSQDVVETIFGEEVADPFRWLEDDVRNNPEVANWVERQNSVSGAYLEQMPANAWFKGKMGELLNFERFGTPTRAGEHYFYSYNSGLMNQSQYFVRDGLDGEGRLLLDPNEWSDDDATALAGTAPSSSGKYLAYAIQDGGSDWRTIRFLDVASGEAVSDEINWAKFTGMQWVGDEGILYSRFPEPEEGQDFQARNFNQAVYFHRIGADQSEDQLVYSTPDRPALGHVGLTTDDGRFAIILSREGTEAKQEVHVVDLAKRDEMGWKPRTLVGGLDHEWNPIESVDGTLYFMTNQGAPKYRIVSIDMDAPTLEWKTVIAESDMPISGASIVGGNLVVEYLKDASSQAVIFDLQGTRKSDIALNGIGSAGGFGGSPSNSETFYSFTSFNRPSTIYRLDLDTNETRIFAQPELTFDPDNYGVEQVFYPSKDGTKIPMFIVKRKDVTGPAPTLLYGYGGFDISLTPGFSSSRMAWMEAGGVFALANIRGGGEYGKEWHDGGRRANKQNTFDDFIAAGEYLKANGVTSEDGLAIQGGSNGGLLVGAVVNQRPDLVNAANAAVGVMDMLRFDRWTAGRYWVDDYGYPDREEDWKVLRAYSPLHNIRSGEEYPAMLVTTADTDDRVVPGHSFKYTAALQAADVGEQPQIIRIETRAGHGSGKPIDKIIEEYGDILSFLAFHTGLAVPSE
ncbi:prolyl oligopeptidase family serine peptidase [Erythrobacter sp. W53]|uniref:prolyl oligopeptidase family serine peptidase n=1 Tax=Erythrobacter sp. W53 TaxID=3425947 RepID=UPI003D769C34